MNPEYVQYIKWVVDAGLIGLLWKGNRALNRWLDIMREYPPHRHFNGRIVYPKGMRPDDTQDILYHEQNKL